MKMTRITPMLPVRNVTDSVAFYRRLGFQVMKQNDTWRWVLLAFDDCQLMLDESINPHPDVARYCVLYLYPDDIAAYHAKVRANGVDVPDLETSFYGMTEFRIEDPDGNRLWIGQSAAPEA